MPEPLQRPAAPGDPAGRSAHRIVGRVETGVERGSVVLRDDTGVVWQVGPALARLAGRRVVVTGAPRPGLMTTAQQGTPLQVSSVSTEDGEPIELGLPGAAGGDGAR